MIDPTKTCAVTGCHEPTASVVFWDKDAVRLCAEHQETVIVKFKGVHNPT